MEKNEQDLKNIPRWVNYQGLLEACVVGKLVEDPVVPNLPPPSMEPSRHGTFCVLCLPFPGDSFEEMKGSLHCRINFRSNFDHVQNC